MSITELLEEHSVPYRLHGDHHHVGRNWVGVDCPYCSPNSGHFRMGWSNTKKYLNCWSCGPCRTGETLALLLNISPDRAYKLAKELKVRDDLNPRTRSLDIRGELKIPAGVGQLTPYHKRYLMKRGFAWRNLVKMWEIEAIGMAPRLSWRIYIPIHDEKGEVVSWTTRAISDRQAPRYLTAKANQEKVNHKHLLYGEWKVKGHAVIVTEGPTDVWAIGPGAVATTGLSYGPHQVWRIAQYPVRVICFDSEPAAQAKADKLCEQLAPFEGETYRVRLESGKDPGECIRTEEGRKELDWLRRRFLSDVAGTTA